MEDLTRFLWVWVPMLILGAIVALWRTPAWLKKVHPLAWEVEHRDIRMGVMLRWWQGYSYSEYDRRVEHFAIVPLNFLIGWWERWGRYALRRGYRDALLERQYGDGWGQGYRSGYNGGWNDGYGEGDNQARADMSAAVDRLIEEHRLP